MRERPRVRDTGPVYFAVQAPIQLDRTKALINVLVRFPTSRSFSHWHGTKGALAANSLVLLGPIG